MKPAATRARTPQTPQRPPIGPAAGAKPMPAWPLVVLASGVALMLLAFASAALIRSRRAYDAAAERRSPLMRAAGRLARGSSTESDFWRQVAQMRPKLAPPATAPPSARGGTADADAQRRIEEAAVLLRRTQEQITAARTAARAAAIGKWIARGRARWQAEQPDPPTAL
eukprot:TRINITY_DN56502_c0_g1_i1.p1 TRINITY_DN56502_c0_g1~~TRINITY_DN56502_c0_g1_i1.p1  ORF type:complete len:189 (+),score=53.77 TRINITY_DN56502_c0_g1_i1:61-567(+)